MIVLLHQSYNTLIPRFVSDSQFTDETLLIEYHSVENICSSKPIRISLEP